jgi:hypothetical protein
MIGLCTAVVGAGATAASAQAPVSTATAEKRSVIQHVSFQSEPFVLDLTDPTGSAQCDVQAVGYDTGVINVITVFDATGLPTRDIFVQSLSTILTNPANGNVLELRGANVRTTSYTYNPDGSLTIVGQFGGLNVLHRGETRFVSAGHESLTLLVRFDEAGNLSSVDVVKDFRTPRLAHAYPFFCEMLA